MRWIGLISILFFTTLAMAEATVSPIEQDTEHVQYWIRTVQNHPMQMIRKNAARALGSIGDRAATPALIRALQDSFFGVRVEAAYSIGLLTDKSALGALMEAASKDSDALVRRRAREAIQKINAHQEFIQKRREKLERG